MLIPCPECKTPCNGPRLLGLHRRNAHGIPGKTSTKEGKRDYARALYRRRRPHARYEQPGATAPTSQAPVQSAVDLLNFCPSCGLNLAVIRKVTAAVTRTQHRKEV